MSEVITIDGPAASGKSTVGHLLADRLHFHFLDSGVLYRAVAYFFLQKGITEKDTARFAEALSQLHVTVTRESGEDHVCVNEEDITQMLHDPEITRLTPIFAQYLPVREFVKKKQRELGDSQNTVMTGRDTGVSIYPESKVKFFITASPEVRAERRYKQLIVNGKDANYEKILTTLKERDFKDATRELAPFHKADDAIEVNTDVMTVDGTVDFMYKIAAERLGLEKE